MSACGSEELGIVWLLCLLAVDSWVVARLEIVHGGFDPFLLSYTCLALAVEVPDGLGE